MTNEEAIESFEHSNKQAKLRLEVEKMRMDSGEIKELEFYIERDEMAIKALEQEPYDFARWVATEIFDENWEYNKDAFAEIACRKLAKLGIVRAKGDEWELIEPQESIDSIVTQIKKQMRPATAEERQGEKEYIDSISDPTGVNFNDLLKVENKPQGEEKNICDSCRNKACIFDSHVKRQKCDFYKPQPKTGRWIPDVDRWGDIVTTVNGYRCSECNAFNTDKDNYCPNCGAKMESREKE